MVNLVVLYGSETGTAQDTAENINREARLLRIPSRIHSLDEYDVDSLAQEKYVIFVVSTTGQGELPPNMRVAWRRLLRRSLPKNWLDTVSIGVLGLGDSSYQKYNFAGKKLFRRLIQLGATPLSEIGLADDQHELGIDGALIPFKENVFMALRQTGDFQNMLAAVNPSESLPAKYRFGYEFDPAAFEDVASKDQTTDYRPLEVVANERVTDQDHFQDTRLLTLRLSAGDSAFSYSPGDVLMVWPRNHEESLELLYETLGLSDKVLDKKFVLRTSDEFGRLPPQWLIPQPTTLRTCLECLLDIQSIPKKSFFQILGSLSCDAMEQERLLELASPQGLDDLIDYCNRPRRTIAETFRDFPATARQIPPWRLFDLLPTIRPRAFSIASSPLAHMNVIQIIVAKVEYKSRMSVLRRGLCSTFIARLKPSDKVFCKIRSGTFRFPTSAEPVICVGPGTGVAPFRSYLANRQSETAAAQSMLFFGCRHPLKDFYFEDEWSKMDHVRVVTAFSRTENQDKVYVQDRLKELAEDVWQIIKDKNGSVYIAGSAGAMPEAVTKTLKELAQEKGDESFVESMEKQGRLQFETWS